MGLDILQKRNFLKNLVKGFYSDNYHNRKLNRVGMPYGKQCEGLFKELYENEALLESTKSYLNYLNNLDEERAKDLNIDLDEEIEKQSSKVKEYEEKIEGLKDKINSLKKDSERRKELESDKIDKLQRNYAEACEQDGGHARRPYYGHKVSAYKDSIELDDN